MNTEKYIGLDVHQATIAVAVLDHTGKLIMECILETKAATILEFFAGLRGPRNEGCYRKTGCHNGSGSIQEWNIVNHGGRSPFDRSGGKSRCRYASVGDGTSLRTCTKGGHHAWEAPSGREDTRK